MSYSSLKSIACAATYDVQTRDFRCQQTGDLLEVVHNLDRIKAQYPDLKERFEKRLSERDGPYASGVWRYHEIILPDLPLEDIVSMPEGSTGLYRRTRVDEFLGCEKVFIKHEGENPTLSFKDRGMTAGVSWANHVGAQRVACASTGDTSAAMACYAASSNTMRGIVLLPHNKITDEQLAQAISYGSTVLALDTDFDGCMRLVKELTQSGHIYLLNSMNPFRIEGQKSIGIEIVHQMGWSVPDWIVIPVGNGGNISALGKGLIELKELGLIDRVPRIAGIQVDAANPFYQSYKNDFSKRHRLTASTTVASAIQIGDPVSYDKARKVIQLASGVVAEVSDLEAMDAKAVSDSSGVNICPNSGVALAGARKLRVEGTILPSESIVVIATAHGSKFGQSALNYHRDTSRDHANHVVRLPADLAAIQSAISVG